VPELSQAKGREKRERWVLALQGRVSMVTAESKLGTWKMEAMRQGDAESLTEKAGEPGVL
jgi:hypothetical protein